MSSGATPAGSAAPSALERAAAPARILLAAEAPGLRADLRSVLERGGRFSCFEAADAGSAIAAGLTGEFAVCIVGLLDHDRRVATLASIAAGAPRTRLAVLAPPLAAPELLAVLRAGAVAYLPADRDLRELPDLIEALLAGEASLPGDALSAVLFALRSEWRRAIRRSTRDARLTPREWEVLKLLAEDLSTSEIARQLGIAEVTVRSHIAAMLRKLDVRSRQAALRAYRQTDGFASPARVS